MRPLSSSLKTAVIFYLVYAGLVILVSVRPPVKPAVSTGLDSERWKPAEGYHNLSELQSSFDALWEEALARHGWDRNRLLLDEEIKLEERRFGTVEVKWVSSKSKLALPEAANEEDLVKLAGDWQRITGLLGLNSTKIKWGYAREHLWVRLANQVKVKIPTGNRLLPVYQVTVIAPPGDLKRKWPGLIPRLPPELAPEPPVENEILRKPPVIKKPKVALIIDDVGSVREAADALLKIPARLTWAVLPFTPYAQEYIEAAQKQGFEIILHLPLEPLDQCNNPGPGLIKSDWSEAEITKQLEENLNQVPGAVGINNHMGSAGTANERLMDLLMRQVKKRNLFFVDSMTNKWSVAEKYARLHRVGFKKRQVFIDNLSDLESKKAALRKLLNIALAEGEAVGIGHVRVGTAQAIIEMLPEYEKAGVEIVPVSELLRPHSAGND